MNRDRQIYRLFLMDFLGIGTLLLPSYLAGEMGVYGGLGILGAGVLGLLYQRYLIRCRKKLQTDLITRLSTGTFRLSGALLAAMHTATGGFVGALIANLVQKSLIREESYLIVLSLVFLAAAYAIAGDAASRARVYEILFWFVLAPLLFMLLLAAKEMDAAYYVPRDAVNFSAAAKSAYVVFACFGSLFAVMFYPQEKERENVAEVPDVSEVPGASDVSAASDLPNAAEVSDALGALAASSRRAFVTAVLILLGAYYVLIGTFGAKALSVLPYPVITLMNMVQFDGGFLKRLDALMLAVWFYALFALFTMNLSYGSRLLRSACMGQRERGRIGRSLPGALSVFHLAVLLGAFLIGLLIGTVDGAKQLFIDLFLYIQIPLYIILPGVLTPESYDAGVK